MASASPPEFRAPVSYRAIRHPLYTGFILAFWATPEMSLGHLLRTAAMTFYILVAIRLEERDLMREHPEYAAYRERVPMLVPALSRQSGRTVARETPARV